MNVIPYREALRLMNEKFAAIGVTETLPTDKTVGRICAKDVFCPENLPPYRRSTVDGYALKSSDAAVCSPAAPAVLKVVGAVEMGQKPANKIKIGECMYIPTGGMLPEGSDCVVMIEQIERIGEEICLSSSLSYMENVVEIGEDYKKGERIVEKGTVITAMRAAALAGAGVKTAEVVKKPKYFVISTGDELVNYDEECPLGKVRDVNTLLLTYAAPLWECVGSVKVKDDYDKLKENIAFLKLEAKYPFLIIAPDFSLYRQWNKWYPEANRFILKNKSVSLRSRIVQSCARYRMYWIVWLHYQVVCRFIYGVIYK